MHFRCGSTTTYLDAKEDWFSEEDAQLAVTTFFVQRTFQEAVWRVDDLLLLPGPDSRGSDCFRRVGRFKCHALPTEHVDSAIAEFEAHDQVITII